MTADGWNVAFQRLLVVAGEVELDGDDCDPYAENDYSRIFDAARPMAQRLGIFYGLGSCDFAFQISVPKWDTILGAGVTEADSIALRTPGSDAHAEEAGISIFFEGSAEKLGTIKRFQWPFRRFIQYEECSFAAADTEAERGVTLAAEQQAHIDLAVHGEVLFLDFAGSPASTTAFEPFRAADDEHGDADGLVTLAELQETPWEGAPDLDGTEWPTLGDRVYLGLLQHVVRFRGSGACELHASATEPDEEGPF